MTIVDSICDIKGTGIALEANDIDTDRIIPARFLKALSFTELGNQVFYDERKQTQSRGQLHPFDDVLRANAKVLAVAKNFGCGSSREHAPQALRRWGIEVVIGESFGEIFRGNCASIGLVCLTVTRDGAAALRAFIKENPGENVHVDLQEKTVSFGEDEFPFSLSEAVRERLISGRWNIVKELLSNKQQTRMLFEQLPYTSDKNVNTTDAMTNKNEKITKAVEIIENGGVVILPADTVYGIYGNALDERSVERAFGIKGRKRSKPLGIVSSKNKISDVVELNDSTQDVINSCWPAPVSVIAPKKVGRIPEFFSGGEDGLLVVNAQNDILAEIVERTRVPIYSTTCNLAGEDEARTSEDLKPFQDLVDLVIENNSFEFAGTPSTIVNTMSEKPIVIREGSYPVDELISKVSDVSVDTKMLIQ